MYKVVIPSYKRADILQEKTLKLLQNTGISPDDIYIFVADQKEYEEYQNKLKSNSYNKLIIGEVGINKQRNYIRRYFPPGENLFFIDDDIQNILLLQKNNKLQPITQLNTLIQKGFQLLHKQNASLLGVYPSHNNYFMSHTLSSGLYFICGGAYWNINNHNPHSFLKLRVKDDYERTILEYKQYGKVLRFNNIALDTHIYKGKGGTSEYRTPELMNKESQYLATTYPQYIQINPNRKSGYKELRFKRQKRNHTIKIC